MAGLQLSCFLWKCPVLPYIDEVLSVVSNVSAGSADIVVCSSAFATNGNDCFPSVQAFLLDLCRSLGLLPNRNTTYLSPRDHTLALRLVMDSVARKGLSNDCITESDFTFCERQYVKSISHELSEGAPHAATVSAYREFLKKSNAVNDWTLGSVLSRLENKSDGLLKNHLLVLGNPTRLQEVILLKLLIGHSKLYSVSTETTLDASFCQNSKTSENNKPESVEVDLLEPISLDEHLKIEVPPKHPGSAGQRHSEDVHLAFLRLIVNIRDELALVKALMSPLVDLPQEAFLSFKRTSATGELSICQTVLSYITRIQLGGHSYAPSADCPLRAYLTQLRTFGEILDKLQTVVEENTSPVVAVKKIISCVTNRFLKTTGGSLRPESIQAAANRLMSVVESLEGTKHVSPGLVSQAYGVSTIHFLQKVLDRCASWHQAPLLLPGVVNPDTGTPVTAISPFTFFRTPTEVETDSLPSLSQRICSKKDSLTPVCRKKFKAGLPWGADSVAGEGSHNSKKSDAFQEHSTGIMEKVHWSVPRHSSPQQSNTKQRGIKRSIFGEITNQDVSKIVPVENTNEKSKVTRKSKGILKQKKPVSEQPVATADVENSCVPQVVQSTKTKENCRAQVRTQKGARNSRKKQKISDKNQTSIETFFKRL